MIIKQLISKTAPAFNLDFLVKKSGQKLILPFYHTISDENLPHLTNLYPILSTNRFRKDLDFLMKNYSPVNASELLHLFPEKLNEKRRFFLSFDDGFSEIYNVIAPILIDKGIPATFFLNTDFIDNRDLFYRVKTSILIEKIRENNITNEQINEIKKALNSINISYKNPKDLLDINFQTKAILERLADILEVDFQRYAQEKKPYLTTEQIKSLINQGFSIGAHSCSHPYYYLISEEEQIKETISSIQFLNENFDIQEKLFAFPYTDFEVKKSFFDKISNEIDLSFGTASLKLDTIPNNLQRIPMERKNSAEEILKEEYLLFILKKTINKHKIIRH